MACHTDTGTSIIVSDKAGTSIVIFVASSAAGEAISAGASVASQATIMTLGTDTAG